MDLVQLKGNLLEAQAEAAIASARKLDEEAAHLRAQTHSIKCEDDRAMALHVLLMEQQRIETDAAQREEAEKLANRRYRHIFHFTDSVGSTSVRLCLERLDEWAVNAPSCDIEIVFTSPGGDAIWGMVLFDRIQELRRAGHKVTTSTLGMAASMAGILLQAGDHRVMGREAWLLIHEVSAGTQGKIGEMEDTVKMLERMCARIVDIFMARCGGKITRKRFIESWKRQDWWLTAEEALAYGFVDEIR